MISFKTNNYSFLSLFDLNKDNEQNRFLAYYVSSSLKSIRLAIALGFLLYGVFGVVDFLIARHNLSLVWTIRYGVVMPSTAVIFALTFTKNFVRFSQLILTIISLIFGLGTITIIFSGIPDEFGSQYYYPGLILCVFGMHALVRLKAEIALTISSLIILAYNIGVLAQEEINYVLLAMDDLFLIGAYCVGIISSNANEKMFFRDYQQVEIIKEEKAEIAQFNQKLQEMNLLKSKLISIMSHDIRGPVSSIKGILNLYDLGLITENEFKKNTKILSDSVDNTILLLENLLSWSVLQIENQPEVKKSVNIHSLVDGVFSLLRLQSDKKQIRLINSVDPAFEVFIESNMMELVIRNLISNTIRFTDGGRVEVNVTQREKYFEVSVSDNGVGISENIAINLFSLQKPKRDMLETGLGFGLIVCREFVEKLGGQISYQANINEGSAISLTFPWLKVA